MSKILQPIEAEILIRSREINIVFIKQSYTTVSKNIE